MATSITFTDGTGSVTLTNEKPTPADRFSGWTPLTLDNESVTTTLTGTRARWKYATWYGARFRLEHIPAARLDRVQRLLRHLRDAGTVTVNTGDQATRSYTCTAWPEWDIPLGPEQEDPAALWYRLELQLKNGSAADMLCVYFDETA